MDYLDISAGVLDDGDYTDAAPAIDERSIPNGLREYALRTWLFDAGRNPRRVVEVIKERTSIELDVATIRRWALLDDWEGKGRESHQKLQIVIDSHVQFSVQHAASLSAQWLVDAIKDPTINEHVKFKVAQLALGLAGYVPLPSGASSINLAVHMGSHELSQYSDEELDAQARAYDPSSPVHPPIDITNTEAALAVGNRKAS